MATIKVIAFKQIGADDRGTTSEIVLDRAGNALSIFRKKGSVFGNHYHEGVESAKNPEKFYVLHGQLKFETRFLNQDEWIETLVEAPAKIEIYPNIIHRVTAMSDAYMLELNSLQEHINDTKYPQ